MTREIDRIRFQKRDFHKCTHRLVHIYNLSAKEID